MPAQPNGLGNRTGEARALKARSISIPGITLPEFVPMPWRQPRVFFLETPLNGLLARCGTSILRSMISEIGPRRWRLGFFVGDLDLGRCPRLIWAGPLARVTPGDGRPRPVLVKIVQTPGRPARANRATNARARRPCHYRPNTRLPRSNPQHIRQSSGAPTRGSQV